MKIPTMCGHKGIADAFFMSSRGAKKKGKESKYNKVSQQFCRVEVIGEFGEEV